MRKEVFINNGSVSDLCGLSSLNLSRVFRWEGFVVRVECLFNVVVVDSWSRYSADMGARLKVRATVFGDMLKKILVFRGVPFPVLASPRVSVPLNS